VSKLHLYRKHVDTSLQTEARAGVTKANEGVQEEAKFERRITKPSYLKEYVFGRRVRPAEATF